MDALNNVVAPDNAPTAASTIDHAAPASRAIADVNNAAIYWQVKTGRSPSEADWKPVSGSFMTPGSRRIPSSDTVYGFRFWAAVPLAQLPAGTPQARVTVVIT